MPVIVHAGMIPAGVCSLCAVLGGLLLASVLAVPSELCELWALVAALSSLPALWARKAPSGILLLVLLATFAFGRGRHVLEARLQDARDPGFFELAGEVVSAYSNERFEMLDGRHGRWRVDVHPPLRTKPRPGEWFRVRGRHEKERTLVNFGDAKDFFRRPRLLLRTTPGGVSRERSLSPFDRWVMTRREATSQRLLEHVSADATWHGRLSAVLLGTRSLPLADKLATRHVGLAHLVVVSGLHLALFLLLPLQVLSGLGVRRSTRRLCIAGLIVAYGLLTGPHVPLRRAMVLGLAALLCDARGRPHATWSTLGYAASVEAYVEPGRLVDLSFLFSYVAVFGLLWSHTGGRPRSVIWRNLKPALAATLATAPLAHLAFGAFSLHGIWLSPLLTPLVALGIALGFLGLATDIATLTQLAMLPIGLFLNAAHLVDTLPGTPMTPARNAAVVTFAIAFSLLLLLRKKVALTLAFNLALVALWLTFADRDRQIERYGKPDFFLEVLDVGHGSCA